MKKRSSNVLKIVFVMSCMHSFYSSCNAFSLFAGFSYAFGSGALSGGSSTALFGPLSFFGGVTVGGIFSAVRLLNNKKSLSGAQAPGLPTEKDGFFPPKNWDGKKRKHQINGKVGWPDKSGNIWVPTGPGSSAHGGPHWDVQAPDGRHKNIYPGGKVRR